MACGCGCKGKPAATGGCGGGVGDADPILDIKGVPPGTQVSSGTSASALLPYVAAGGLFWFLFLRKKRRR